MGKGLGKVSCDRDMTLVEVGEGDLYGCFLYGVLVLPETLPVDESATSCWDKRRVARCVGGGRSSGLVGDWQ